MFIGREYELQELEKLYQTESFQMPVVYGRRRVGKTTLLREFVKTKKCVFYTAIESSEKRNLELFSQSVYQILLPGIKGIPAFQSFEDALTFLYDRSKEERLILVIDEYPYLAGACKSISSILQRYIDEYFQQTRLFLILCGSSMSFMEQQVLGYQSPLFGRRTAQFLIRPFDYLTSARFVPGYSIEEKAVVYGITGGIPRYLELMDDRKTLRDNIIDLFLKENGYLFEEPSNLLKQELRDPGRYNAIIEAIASGASKISELAGKTHMDTAAVTHNIETLIALGIISKENAVSEENNKKKTYYTIADSMFRFWYRFVPNGMDVILSKNGDYLYDEIIANELSDFMGQVYETMCRQYLMELNRKGELPVKILKIGRWWGNNPKEKREEEIDIIGINTLKKQAIFAECKYRNQPLGMEVFQNLIEKAGLVKGVEEKYYVLFSKSSFTENVMMEGNQVLLVSLEDMYRG